MQCPITVNIVLVQKLSYDKNDRFETFFFNEMFHLRELKVEHWIQLNATDQMK